VARDTTHQREADVARAQLVAIVNGTDDAVIGQTLDGVITSWNPAAERQYGHTAEEAIGQSIRLIVPVGEACELDELHHIRQNQPVRLHNTVRRRKDGSHVHVEISVSPIRDLAGNVVGAASISRDITDRLKAEQRFRQLVLAAPDAMVIVDDRGTIVLVNEQTERLFGYQGAELIGKPVDVLVPPGVRGQHAAHRQSYLADPRYRRMGSGLELSGVRQDGSEFPVEISLSPLETDQGMLVSAAIRDTSDRREVERALADARDNALAAAQLKSQFVAMVSHEIRTPMNGVIGLTGLLLETPLQPAQRRYAESIQASGRALLTIINDILDFSKIEAGKLKLVDADFQLDQVLEEVVQAVAEAARNKHLEIVCDYAPDIPTGLRGDDGRLRQALLNLVGNAVKFTEQGNVVLRAERTGGAGGDRQRVTFTVIDTGIGIARENLAKLFEPFSQADAHSTRKYGGTGLGLTITRQLVELMGGQLEAASELGRGSQFWFTLDFAPQPHPPQRRTHLGLRDCMNGNRLLVVDDNPTSLRLIARHAKAWGMNPSTVLDGHSALKYLREAGRLSRPFRVAIIDQHMPGFDGVELTRTIGTHPDIPPLKVILLTSGSYEDDQNAESAGAAAVLPKPIGPSQLYNCLLELLQPEDLPPRPRKSEPAPEIRAGAHGLVLLAEDNEINQMVAVDTLSMLGYEVDVARDGIEVLELAGTKPYRAILMDCQMPRMDGYTATAELRKRERGDQHIPIIAMTAHALAEDRQRCLAAGMDDYLAKPIDPVKLQDTLDQWTRVDRPDVREKT
jgi:PAS domain S-box-containing protein